MRRTPAVWFAYILQLCTVQAAPAKAEWDSCLGAAMRKMPFEWRIVKDGYPKPLFQRHSRSTTETVHTFWNDVGVGDPTVLTVWAEHWARHGWMPRVLGIGAAAAHPSFDRLCGEYEKLPTINPKSYTMNNLLRRLAIEAVGGSWMQRVPYRTSDASTVGGFRVGFSALRNV